MSIKPHVSFTQLDMFMRCGEAYRRRYIEKEILPPGVALLKGSGFDGAVTVNGRQKIASHEDLPVAAIKELAAESFQTKASGGYVLTEEEMGRGSGKVLGEAKDATVAMAGFYAENQAPDYQPVLVQHWMLLDLPKCSHNLMSVLDLGDDKDRVVDFKTSGRRKSQDEADTSMQLTIYSAEYKAETGRIPLEVRLDTVVKTKTKIYRDLQVSDRGPKDFEALANRINAMTNAINAGIFPPASPGSWQCSPKWCGYWNSCPYVNSQRKAAADAATGDS